MTSVAFGQQDADLWSGMDETFTDSPHIGADVIPSSVVLQPIEPQSSVEISDSASGPRLVVKVYAKSAHEAMSLAVTLYRETRRQLGLDDTPALRVADRR